jgi:DNA-binding NarL/FixJ family response regulator
MPKARAIAVLVSDQHPVVRRGIASVLARHGFRVVAEADNGRDTVRLARKHRPDLVTTDIPMPMLNGLEATRQIVALRPETKVLLLSAIHHPSDIEAACRVGARGYFEKTESIEQLPAALQQLHQGHTFFTPAVGEYVRQHEHLEGWAQRESTGLTPREIEVIQLIAEGYPNKRIADLLGISSKTVEKHRDTLMQKLHTRGTAGLTAFAIRAGKSQGT